MISKPSRLPRDEFRARGYRTAATPFFLLKIKKNLFNKVRIGVVVGKPVHKSAVKRNFWKRQAKAGLLPIAEKFPSGADILMIFSPGVNSLTKKRFQEELARAMANAQK